ncbi:CPS_HP_G0110290.mRNA.1.CDS.1 [Saccharomyces cerevisiae]|nr:CPS_HP_G0110290.mRNA.1.CDS.1 [Saccharomyces cerevisiae]CAI6957999.1 CPS_HP_G0110290.mRNA.1.CDS.1 [Saccharomyces cerevisiae]
MDCKIKAAGKNSGIFHEGGTKSSKSFLTVFIRSVFPLSPSFPAGGGIWGPMEKKPGGGWEKKGVRKKTARGNIFFSTERDAGQEKCGILYKHCFSILYGFFWKKADKPKEKTGNGSGLGIVFPIGQKKIPEPADSDIFLPCFRYAAASDFTKAKRFLVEITAVYWVSLEAQPSSASCLFNLI